MPYVEDAYAYDVTEVVDVEVMSDARFLQWARKAEQDCFRATQAAYNPRYRTSFRVDHCEALKEKFITDAKLLRDLSPMFTNMREDGETELFMLREAYWQTWVYANIVF